MSRRRTDTAKNSRQLASWRRSAQVVAEREFNRTRSDAIPSVPETTAIPGRIIRHLSISTSMENSVQKRASLHGGSRNRPRLSEREAERDSREPDCGQEFAHFWDPMGAPTCGAEYRIDAPAKSATRPLNRGLITPPRSVGGISSDVASMSEAPTLILTAPDAAAPRIAMVVRTTAAQGERRRSRR
jgi:hypothetical protein